MKGFLSRLGLTPASTKRDGLTDEHQARIRLYRTESIGPITFFDLLKRYGSALEAIDQLPTLAAQGGKKKPLTIPSQATIEKEIHLTESFGASYVFFDDNDYPDLLRTLSDPPPFLVVKGQRDLLQRPCFAIVGSRNASAHGKKMAEQIAKALGTQGWAIASGLARGIDRAAHEGSLSTGTLGVIASGINHIYPPEHVDLYKGLMEQGLIITESPFNTPPQSTFFPKRNRVIAGLSRGVLVVEAAIKSGSLITGHYAAEQGRDVFAVPGHPFDPRARGTNALLKQGAILTESVEDILHHLSLYKEIPSLESSVQENDLLPLSKDLAFYRRLILENLSFTPLPIDELAKECKVSAPHLWALLLELEIAGKVQRLPGLKVVRLPDEEN